jgi:hypothetical protein
MSEHRPIATGFFPWGRIGFTVGVVMGVAGLLFRFADEEPTDRPAPVVTVTPVAVPPPQTVTSEKRQDEWPTAHLYGPQTTWPIPLRGPLVVHVWLEGCPDCMPAFEAHKRLKERGALDDVSQINVAYGRATPEFAKQWRVDERLVFDADGNAVVKPFGIGTFTTLVLDREGRELVRARPDEPDYVNRVVDGYRRATFELREHALQQ